MSLDDLTDDEWFNALSANSLPSPSADPSIRSLRALRNAIEKRNNDIENISKTLGPVEFGRLRAKMVSAGALAPVTSSNSTKRAPAVNANLSTRGPKKPSFFSPYIQRVAKYFLPFGAGASIATVMTLMLPSQLSVYRGSETTNGMANRELDVSENRRRLTEGEGIYTRAPFRLPKDGEIQIIKAETHPYPVQFVHVIQSKAWDAGVPTLVIRDGERLSLYLLGLKNTESHAQLKGLLDLTGKENGVIRIDVAPEGPTSQPPPKVEGSGVPPSYTGDRNHDYPYANSPRPAPRIGGED